MRHHSQETAPSLYVQAAKDAFRKLDPRVLVRNPVMFVVAVGCVFTTASFFSRVVTGADAGFSGQISLWLWFTVLFANFAEALAEGRGKAQADTLRSARTDTVAHRLLSDGTVETVSASELAPGDRVVVEAGDMIPADGTVVEGVAAVDESAITGESAPVIRESGGDRSAVTGGTTVLSDRIVVNVTQEPGKSFLDRMIALVEGAERQKTPNEIALNILLAGLTLIFMLVVVTLKPLGLYHGINIDMVVLVALLVCLIPTTISGLLAAIGIAGMDRLLQLIVLALSGRAVEAVMVALSSWPTDAESLIRRGVRMANQLGSPCYVVYVRRPQESPTRIDAGIQRQLQHNLQLATRLGAEVVQLEGVDIAETLVNFASERNVRHAIFGKSRLSPLRERLRGSFLLDFLYEAVGVDVHVANVTPKYIK